MSRARTLSVVASAAMALAVVAAIDVSGQPPVLYNSIAETCRAHGFPVAWHRDAPSGSVWRMTPLTASVALAPVPSYWEGVRLAGEMNSTPASYPCAPSCTTSDGLALAVERYHRTYALRYGHAIGDANGYLAEETYSDGGLWERMNAEGNPLGMACNPNCPWPVDNAQEEHDAKIAGNYAMVSCWSGFLDRHPTPPPTPTPQPTQTPPAPTPTATPAPPPVPGALMHREIPCPPSDPARSTGQLCLEIYQP